MLTVAVDPEMLESTGSSSMLASLNASSLRTAVHLLHKLEKRLGDFIIKMYQFKLPELHYSVYYCSAPAAHQQSSHMGAAFSVEALKAQLAGQSFIKQCILTESSHIGLSNNILMALSKPLLALVNLIETEVLCQMVNKQNMNKTNSQ